MLTTQNQTKNNSPDWLNQVEEEAWREAERIIQSKKSAWSLRKYKYDPVGFCRDVLGETLTSDVQKVMESVVENPITIARSANGPGKTHGAGRVAAWFYRVHEDSKVFLAAAPPFENLKRLLWGEVMAVVRKKPALFEHDIVRSLTILRHEQSYITGVAIPTSGTIEEREAKFSGKHAPFLLFIVDEGDAVPDEVYRGIESCMSGGFARLLIMFNPRAQFGPVYQKERNGQAKVVKLSALNHPNVTSGEDIIPGAVDRTTTIRRINEWTRPLAEKEKCNADCFDIPDFLVGTTAKALNGKIYEPLKEGTRKIIEPAFSYMVLGEYPAQSEMQLISRDWIDKARSRYDTYVAQFGEVPPMGIEPVMGVDVAEFGTDTNAACLRYGNFIPPFITWSGVDPDDSARRALPIYLSKQCRLAFVDGTGIGAGIAPSMVRLGRAKNQKVFAMSVKVSSSPSSHIIVEEGEFQYLRDQLWWAAREWLRTEKAMLPRDQLLLEELQTPLYKKNKRGKIEITNKDTMRKLLKRSPDRADALCLTFTPMERAKVIKLDLD